MASNQAWFQRAIRHLPGGVNSPVRAFQAVGGEPFFTARAEGACLWDVAGKRYLDYVGSWGPMIAGHNHPAVREAVERAIRNGLSFGTPCTDEVTMAETLCELVPALEMVRMVNSGTEATMSAVRLARGATGRDLVVKFEGCYHGHGDTFLVKAGSGALTLGVPNSPGVPAALANLTLNLTYNDATAARQLFAERGNAIACVIVEPVAGNMNCIPPHPGFLKTLRELCSRHGAVLIFDEVMTGFRLAPGGAQELFDIHPDLSTFGKIIGGGMPVGAFGGKRELMQLIAPTGPVYQAGTLSGNPVAMAAGLAMLKLIREPGFHAELQRKTQLLCKGLQAQALDAGIAVHINQVPGMFGLFFSSVPVTSFAQATACDHASFTRFFQSMLGQGVYLAPSPYEAGFISAAHSEADITYTIEAAGKAFAAITYA